MASGLLAQSAQVFMPELGKALPVPSWRLNALLGALEGAHAMLVTPSAPANPCAFAAEPAYQVRVGQLAAGNFGVPQVRKRAAVSAGCQTDRQVADIGLVFLQP